MRRFPRSCARPEMWWCAVSGPAIMCAAGDVVVRAYRDLPNEVPRNPKTHRVYRCGEVLERSRLKKLGITRSSHESSWCPTIFRSARACRPAWHARRRDRVARLNLLGLTALRLILLASPRHGTKRAEQGDGEAVERIIRRESGPADDQQAGRNESRTIPNLDRDLPAVDSEPGPLAGREPGSRSDLRQHIPKEPLYESAFHSPRRAVLVDSRRLPPALTTVAALHAQQAPKGSEDTPVRKDSRNSAKSSKTAPPERLRVYEQGIEEVRRSGVADKALKVGDRAPTSSSPIRGERRSSSPSPPPEARSW